MVCIFINHILHDLSFYYFQFNIYLLLSEKYTFVIQKKVSPTLLFTLQYSDRMSMWLCVLQPRAVMDTLETKLACFWFFPWRVFSKTFLRHSLSQLIPILLLNSFLFPISFLFFTLVPFSIYFFIFLLKLNLDQPTVVLRWNTKKIVGVSLICMTLFYPREWVWVNSGSWWWTGKPGVLRFMGSQRVGHEWATELNWTEDKFPTVKWKNPHWLIFSFQGQKKLKQIWLTCCEKPCEG